MRRYSREMDKPAAVPEGKKYSIIYQDYLDNNLRIQQTKCRVGIAQIGAVEDFFEEKAEGLFGLPQARLAAVRQKIRGMIEKAHKDKIEVLLFPEMTIDLNYEQLLKDIMELARAWDMIIVPGSCHDFKTKANICRVIGPEGIIWEQKNIFPPSLALEKKSIKKISTQIHPER